MPLRNRIKGENLAHFSADLWLYIVLGQVTKQLNRSFSELHNGRGEHQPGLAEYYKTIYPGSEGPQLKHFVTNSPMGILHLRQS